eukprot:m.9074 g.9074  ORF g.9074 m.9074 type:complete len:137 (-) comp5419_c0_seq1:302-712(-)
MCCRQTATMNPQFQEIGQAFAEQYYQTFSESRDQLFNMYQDDSLLTFEGTQHQGQQDIHEKFCSLSFQTVAFEFTAIDCQPRMDGTIFVCVLGQLRMDEDPLNGFTQAFVLAPTEDGSSYYIQNDIFRLNIHNFGA